MITLEKAKEIVLKAKGNDYTIDEIFDMGDSWLFGFSTKSSEGWLFEQPLEVFKEDGLVKSFFPPHNREKFKTRIKIYDAHNKK
ncbi:MAG: hypothetical protein ACI4WH_08125 [Oscillospiraceae bacterium]